jgi:hypothetical protein
VRTEYDILSVGGQWLPAANDERITSMYGGGA